MAPAARLGALALAAFAVVILASPTTVTDAGSTTHPADVGPPDADPTPLLERFAPVLAVRRQPVPCGDGEPYLPIAVDHVLGRSDVVLRDADGDIVTTAPRAADLVGADAGWALDLPGRALAPGCTYEQWFRSMGAEPAVYGRVVVDDERVVAQYWLYYVYNDWNDRHEGDWEMVQLVFGASTIAGALRDGPVLVAYAQHEGSEYAAVDDADVEGITGNGLEKVRLVDGAPIVYPAQGSHAAYFDRSRWFGKSGATGFGCDDTSAPLTLVHPAVIVLPVDAATDGEFAWLSYQGHWGERRPLFNDGPTGPASKQQWDEPVSWVAETGRSGAVRVPFSGSDAIDTFCDLSQRASMMLLSLLDDPFRFSVTVLIVGVGLIGLVRYSSRGVLRAASRSYRVRWARLLVIGGVLVAGAIAIGLLQWAVPRMTSAGAGIDAVDEDSPMAVLALGVATLFVSVPVLAWVLSAVISVTVDDAPTARSTTRRWPVIAGATFVSSVGLVTTLGLTAAVLPLLPLVAGRWLVAPPTCADERIGARAAMRRSATVLHGYRLRAMGLAVVMALLLATTGVLGAIVLVVTDAPFAVATAVTTVGVAAVTPFVALILTEFHAQVVAAPRPSRRARRRDPGPVSRSGGGSIGTGPVVDQSGSDATHRTGTS